MAEFDALFSTCPLIAILRGVTPDEVVGIGHALVAQGIRLIEVPLNSPDPFESLRRLVETCKTGAMVGAGTVTGVDDVVRLKAIGASLVVSPHFDPAVVAATRAHGLVSIPGVATPTEAFGAVAAGATTLKLFPMEMIGAGGVKALKAVLPRAVRVVGVGGVDEHAMSVLKSSGCDGVGLGSTLYKPGMSAEAVGLCASVLRAAWVQGR